MSFMPIQLTLSKDMLAELATYADLAQKYSPKLRSRPDWRQLTTFVPNKSLPVHNWFNCSQAFSAALVKNLLNLLGASSGWRVLDPFSGVGTTAVVCKDAGLRCYGVE